MNHNQHMDQAREIFLKDYKSIIDRQGLLPPSVNKSPIHPPMTVVEYNSMEKDTAKYYLYYSAIYCALQDLKSKGKNVSKDEKIDDMKNNNIKYQLLEEKAPLEKTVSKNSINCNSNIRKTNILPLESEIPSKKSKLSKISQIQSNLEEQTTCRSDVIEIMVVGAGRGRLVEYCVDILSQLNLEGIVHVVEANKNAHKLLKDKFQDLEKVKVYDPIVIRSTDEMKYGLNNGLCNVRLVELFTRKPITMFVSELLGSFADNEFCSEILETCVEIFGKKENGKNLSFSIPESYTTYVCAVSSKTLNNYFKNSNNCESLHLLGLPKDTIVLSDLVKLYTNSCTKSCDNLIGKSILNCDFNNVELTGIAGYFVLKLYKDIYIDTRPCKTQNTYFWVTAFFPVRETEKITLTENNLKITLKLNRKFKKVGPKNNINLTSDNIFDVSKPVFSLWYEWLLVGHNNKIMESEIHNKDGLCHSLYL